MVLLSQTRERSLPQLSLDSPSWSVSRISHIRTIKIAISTNWLSPENVFRWNTTWHSNFKLMREWASASKDAVYINPLRHTANGVDVAFLHRCKVHSHALRSRCWHVNTGDVLTSVLIKIGICATRLEAFLEDHVRASAITTVQKISIC